MTGPESLVDDAAEKSGTRWSAAEARRSMPLPCRVCYGTIPGGRRPRRMDDRTGSGRPPLRGLGAVDARSRHCAIRARCRQCSFRDRPWRGLNPASGAVQLDRHAPGEMLASKVVPCSAGAAEGDHLERRRSSKRRGMFPCRQRWKIRWLPRRCARRRRRLRAPMG